MPKIVVEIMPKPELLDPQGKAVGGALTRIGKPELASVRIGKRFEVTTESPVTDETLAAVREIAAEMFANPIIEDVVSVTVEEA